MPDLGNVQQKVGIGELLERGAEGRDECCRKLVHESDRVRDQDRDAPGKTGPSCRRIERRERLIGDQHIRLGERVHERGLARVRIADKRREEEAFGRARSAGSFALPRDLRETLFQVLDPLPNDLPVALELRFARTTRADAAAETGHLFSATGEAGQAVLELRELDLDPALTGSRVPREDVEDDAGPIDDRHARRLLERPLLRRRELVIGDDDVRPEARDLARDLFGLALPDPGVAIRRAALLDRLARDRAARGRDECAELLERVLGVEPRVGDVQRDEVRAFGRCLGLDHAAASTIAASGSSAVGSNQRIAGSRRNGANRSVRRAPSGRSRSRCRSRRVGAPPNERSRARSCSEAPGRSRAR